MQSYQQYTHQHLFVKTYRQGGLTQDQFLFLSKAAADKVYGEQRFIAALHGVKMSPKKDDSSSTPSDSGFIFGDPKDYAKMTPEEQQAATDKIKHGLKGAKIPIQVLEKSDG